MYSLGVTLWYLLTGRPPFSGSLSHVIAQHLSKPPPWAQLPPIPDDVRALLERMLQKNPAQRPQTPAELRREIEACLGIRTVADNGDLPRLVPRIPSADSLDDPSAGPRVLRPRRDGPAPGTMVVSVTSCNAWRARVNAGACTRGGTSMPPGIGRWR